MAKIPAKNDVSFKRAWRISLLDQETNGQKLSHYAEAAGVSESGLYATADAKEETAWISMRRFLAILPDLKNLSVLQYLCDLAGCLPPVRKPQPNACTARIAADVMSTCADSIRKYSTGLDDGYLDSGEKADILPCIDQLIVAALTMRARVEQADAVSVGPPSQSRELRAVGGMR